VFVTLEGIDRSGKSTQAAMLADALGPETLLLREPGGTEAGERLRALLRDPAVELNPGAEALLFLAARSELATRVIAPAKEAGRDVVCDRYIDSTIAYQGPAVGEFLVDSPEYPGMSALEIGIELGERLNALVIGHCVPDLTILVRVDPETAWQRGQQRLSDGADDGTDRFESRGVEFQRGVAAAYDELAARHPQRIVTVDGSGTPEEVHALVLDVVRERL
jgi:dTMP kinase